jgi:hypothetical protein
MRITKKLFSISFILLISACVTTSNYFQVYQVDPLNESVNNTDGLFYEDENCKVTYDLWSDGGSIGFNFYNKTDNDIYIKLNESNFIMNGFAKDYFLNRTFSKSLSESNTNSNSSSALTSITGLNFNKNIQTNTGTDQSANSSGSSFEQSTSYKEDPIIRIPANTFKRVSEYSINTSLILHCDLKTRPRTKEIETIFYTSNNSPIVFSNRITYVLNGDSKIIENEFFVSQLTNYPESEFFVSRLLENCGKKDAYVTKLFTQSRIDKFYISY